MASNIDPYQQAQAQSQQQPVYQSVPVSSDEIYANQLQQEIAKNIIAQISPDNQLYEIEMRIRGYRKDVHTQNWVKRSKDAEEINDTLVDRFMGYLSSIMNQNTSMSNLSTNQVNSIMKLSIEWVSDDLKSNAEEYGISTNYSERTRVGHMILNPLFMVLNRALNGQESRRVWKSITVAEAGQFGMPQKKPGIMDALKFWK